jgi:hypothetical protein
MADISNCGSKGPATAPGAAPPGFDPSGKTFLPGTWVTVLDWSGSTATATALGFTIQVTGPKDIVVEWERREGNSLDLVSSGSFQKSIDVVLSPKASKVQINVRVNDGGAHLKVTYVGALKQ